MNENTFNPIILFLLLSLPLGTIIAAALRFLKKDLTTFLHYAIFTTASLTGMAVYFGLSFLLLLHFSSTPTSNHVSILSYSAYHLSSLLILPALIITIVSGIHYYTNRNRRKFNSK